MADSELRVSARPELTRPVLIAAFRGWNDGAQAASLAAGYLARLWGADQFAEVDPEGFFDFQATRPHVSLVDGVTRQIDWPETAFYHAQPRRLDRDVVLLLGIEPNVRWRTFTELVVEHARELGIELVVTLGALLADVPHTRPSPVTGSASDAKLVRELGLSTSRYEGPTGIVGVLHDACNKAGIPSASLWAAVPHYVSLTPSPRAAAALCDRLADLLEIEIDTAELSQAAQTYEEQVSQAVAADEETAAYVEELEQRADEMGDEIDLPSGDALAAELTRYLRERESGNGESEPGPREQ
jgi:predicted ATP-grasp superfamily ATP-dependent carboligase